MTGGRFFFRVSQPRQNPLHALKAEINDLGMQGEQPVQYGITARHRYYSTLIGTNAPLLEPGSSADFIRMRATRLTVSRIWWRWTTRSTMP